MFYVLCALLGGALGRRVCAWLIRLKKSAKRKAALAVEIAKERSITLVESQIDKISKATTHDDVDPDYLYPELDDEFFKSDDSEEEAPLPFLPTKWQTSSVGPSAEVNLLLVAQMGLLNSAFIVFGQGAAMHHEVHVVAVLVLLLVLIGDIAFFRFLNQTIIRLKREGALEYVPTDVVFDMNRHLDQTDGVFDMNRHVRQKQVFKHDDNGNVCRDAQKRKIRATMDVNVHPVVACEYIVHADKHHNAVYYEHDPEGHPVKVNNALVIATPDDDGVFAPSAKPVPVNLAHPELQNAKEVPHKDEHFFDRLYLLFRYNGATTGVWQPNTDEATTFLEGYGSTFSRFGAFGYLYYLIELVRKWLDCAFLAFASGPAQTGSMTVVHWLFILVFMYDTLCAPIHARARAHTHTRAYTLSLSHTHTHTHTHTHAWAPAEGDKDRSIKKKDASAALVLVTRVTVFRRALNRHVSHDFIKGGLLMCVKRETV